jgi:signal transduction histidine kinase
MYKDKIEQLNVATIADVEKQKRVEELVIANKEKAERVAELVIANEEKAIQVAGIIIADEEKAKRVAELVIANDEKQKRADELVIADEEKQKQEARIAIADEEKAKRVAELVIANEEKQKRVAELVIADEEKQKRVAELLIANDEKQKRVEELVIANEEKAKRVAELVIANEEKQKRVGELVITNNELQQLLQLNADKDLFISILAHDLRSPFTVLLGLSEFLIDNIRKYNIEEIENHLKMIKNSAQDTFALLEDLLMWIRAQSGKIPFEPQNQSFTDICKNILETLNTNAGVKHITINSINTDEVFVFADSDMVKTVLRNLVSNAIKFTNPGGLINISAEENSDSVTISVSDNGIGLSPDKLKKLFDISDVKKSTTGTAQETGTGFGLLLCKEFVEKHRGKIWVTSECGKGSDFKFSLPVRKEKSV